MIADQKRRAQMRVDNCSQQMKKLLNKLLHKELECLQPKGSHTERKIDNATWTNQTTLPAPNNKLSKQYSML